MVLSMCVLAFVFDSSVQDHYIGFEVWFISIYWSFVLELKNALLNAMLICALGNIPQLFFAFSRSQRSGTSFFFRSYFVFVACIVLPVLTVYLQMGSDAHGFILRPGYLLYQAGYVLSAIGLIIKHREFTMAKLKDEELPEKTA